jgi:HtrA serine peptidase 2
MRRVTYPVLRYVTGFPPGASHTTAFSHIFEASSAIPAFSVCRHQFFSASLGPGTNTIPFSFRRGWIPSVLLLATGFAAGSHYSSAKQHNQKKDGEGQEQTRQSTYTTFLNLLRPLEASADASFTSSILPETPSKRSGGTSTPLAGCLSPYFISDAAAKAAPAVVNILVQQDGVMPGLVGSSGSGFIVSPDGSVLTNAHVVADALPSPALHKNSGGNDGGCGFRGGWGRQHFPVSKRGNSNNATNSTISSDGSKCIAVTLQDGRMFEAEVINYDTVSDLAVLKMKDVNQPLPVAKLGSSSNLRVGEWVVALGSPLHLQNSVSAGIISNLARQAAELGLTGARAEYIQTDASINRGSSGGPLVNLAGEVVGVSCMKALGSDGVSFAIPIDTVRTVIEQLEKHGRVIRPYVGVKLLQLNRFNVIQLRKKDSNFPYVSTGVLVPAVAPGSPAQKAGLKSGDIILRYDGSGKDITTSGFIKQLEQSIGKELGVEVVRPDGKGGGGSVTLTVKIVAEEAAAVGVAVGAGLESGVIP